MYEAFVEPQVTRFQWPAALKARLIAGLVLRIIPRGSPWEGLTFFSPAVLGRVIPVGSVPMSVSVFLHFAISIVYGMLISLVVSRLRVVAAVFAGIGMGLILYAANLAAVSYWFPVVAGSEGPVLFTHIVFGLITAGAYRGLLRRPIAGSPSAPSTEEPGELR